MRRRSKRETLLRAFAHLQEYSRARQRESEGVRGGAMEARDFYTKSARLPRKLMEMEVLFNVGRAFHQVRERRGREAKVSLFHVAARYYRGVLQVAERLRRDNMVSTASDNPVSAASDNPVSTASDNPVSTASDNTTNAHSDDYIEKMTAMFSLEKAAAYNLCLILQASGARVLAAKVRRRYLTFESRVC